MLYEFCYYLALSGTFCMTVAGLTYHFNRNLFNNVVKKLTWSGLTIYHELNEVCKDLVEECTSEDTISDVSENAVISYTATDGHTVTTDVIPPMSDMLFVKRKIGEKTYCKRINETADIKKLNFSPISKPFIQVELQQNNKSIDIHDHLHYFYVKDNHILDNIFLKWYIKYWFYLDLATEYKINIIDENINMLSLDTSQSILFGEDDYIVVNNTQ